MAFTSAGAKAPTWFYAGKVDHGFDTESAKALRAPYAANP